MSKYRKRKINTTYFMDIPTEEDLLKPKEMKKKYNKGCLVKGAEIKFGVKEK